MRIDNERAKEEEGRTKRVERAGTVWKYHLDSWTF